MSVDELLYVVVCVDEIQNIIIETCGRSVESVKVMQYYALGCSAYKIAKRMKSQRPHIRKVIHSAFAEMNESQREIVNARHCENEEYIKAFSIRNMSPNDAKKLFELIIDIVVDRCVDGKGLSSVNMNVGHIADMMCDKITSDGGCQYDMPDVRMVTRSVLRGIGFTQRWSRSNRNVLVWDGTISPRMAKEYPKLANLTGCGI